MAVTCRTHAEATGLLGLADVLNGLEHLGDEAESDDGGDADAGKLGWEQAKQRCIVHGSTERCRCQHQRQQCGCRDEAVHQGIKSSWAADNRNLRRERPEHVVTDMDGQQVKCDTKAGN